MGITSTVTSALTSDLAKFAGKKFLESSFPQLYGLHKEYKQYKKEREKNETPENNKTEIQKDFEAIENDIKDTNTLLETEVAVMGSQTAIMQQMLDEIKEIRKQLLLGGFGSNLPDIERNRPKGKVRTRPGYKYNEKTQRYHNEKTNRMVSAEEATGVKQEKKPRVRPKPKIEPPVQAEEKVSKSVLQKFVKFLEKKGATKLAQKIGVKVAAMAGGAIVPGIGWIFDAVLIASSIYDIYEAYQYWQEFKKEEEAVKPTSYKQPLAQTKNPIPVLPDAVTPSDKKQILSSLEYKITNGITLKSDELKIIADKLVLSEDLIKLLTELAKNGSSQSTAQADSQDRTRELTDVGARLGGGRSPAAKSQEAKPGEAGKNLTTVTAKKSGKSDKVGSAYAANFQGFLDDLEATGYQIKTLGGYSFRGNKNNPSMLSYHGMGAALDVNAATNPFHTRQTDMPRNVGEIAKAHGLGWGISFEDPMHFSAAKREGGSFDIAQQRMPGYASGTPYVPQTGVATVGELGSETIVGKDGIRKTAAGAHTMMLRKGESVIPAGEKRSAAEIGAEYNNAKAFAKGTKPTLDQYANEKIQNFLNDPEIKYNPRMQMGLRGLGKNGKYGPEGNIIDSRGGAMHTVMESTGERERILGGYIPPNASGQKFFMNAEDEIKNKARSISDYKNQIVVQTLGREIYSGDENLKTILKHEVGHAAAQKYYDRGSLEENPELYARAQSVLGDAQAVKGGTSEEARQRLQDLKTRSETMTGDELEDWSRKIMEDTIPEDWRDKPLLETLQNHEARTGLYNAINEDIDRVAREYYPEQALRIPEGSSIHMLDTMGQYK